MGLNHCPLDWQSSALPRDHRSPWSIHSPLTIDFLLLTPLPILQNHDTRSRFTYQAIYHMTCCVAADLSSHRKSFHCTFCWDSGCQRFSLWPQQTRNHFWTSWHVSYWFILGTAPPVRVSCVFTRHGVKYIEMYLNTNTFEGFKYKYF